MADDDPKKTRVPLRPVRAGRRLRGHLLDDVPQARDRGVPRGQAADRSRASTAGTSSTGTPTAWRSASAASCAPGPARPTRSSSRARTTTTPRAAPAGSRPGERYGRVYQINYLRCIFCGLCIEACPTRALTMTNFYELADDNRGRADLRRRSSCSPRSRRACSPPPHPMVEGMEERDYYQGKVATATPEQRTWVERTSPSPRTARRRPATRSRASTPSRPTRPPGRPRKVSADDQRWRGVPVLGPRADQRARRARPAVRQEGRPRGPRRRAGDDHPRASSTSPQDAEFLGIVQIFVYTGAVMMLFLFVLMLVGVDSSDSLVETIKGQRGSACCSPSAWACLLIAAIGGVTFGQPVGLTQANAGRQRHRRRRPDLRQVRLGLRGHQRAADHRRPRRHGAGPPRAARRRSASQREWSERRFRDGTHRRRPAGARRLRPAQRGRHPGAAARRHPQRAVGVAGAHRP